MQNWFVNESWLEMIQDDFKFSSELSLNPIDKRNLKDIYNHIRVIVLHFQNNIDIYCYSNIYSFCILVQYLTKEFWTDYSDGLSVA